MFNSYFNTVNTFSCTSNFTPSHVRDSQKSFPSGHTSMSVYTSLYMMVTSFILFKSCAHYSNSGSFGMWSVVLGSDSSMASLISHQTVPSTIVGLFCSLLQPDSHHRSSPSLVGCAGRCNVRSLLCLRRGQYSSKMINVSSQSKYLKNIYI